MTPYMTPVLPPEADRLVRDELRPGEQLVWAGQPLPRLFGRQSIALVIFGIPWTAFAVFWVAAAGGITSHARNGNFLSLFSCFPLFGLPFVLVGLGMLSSPFWMRRKAMRTAYAVTNQRAIVFEGRAFGGIKVQSFMPDRLTSMTRTERADGSGDLVFEQFQQRVGSGTNTVRRGFFAVERVRDVENLILGTLLAGRARPQ